MSRRLFVAYFEQEKDILGITKAAREKGYTIEEVYTPYAVHGLDKAMGLKASRLPWVCLAFGIFGASAKLWFQIWTSAQSWPVNVGGKPLASIPAFVPVTFEITVLFAGLGTVGAFLLGRKLLPGRKPKRLFPGSTDNRFVIVIVETDASFSLEQTTALCRQFNCVQIEERIEEEDA